MVGSEGGKGRRGCDGGGVERSAREARKESADIKDKKGMGRGQDRRTKRSRRREDRTQRWKALEYRIGERI